MCCRFISFDEVGEIVFTFKNICRVGEEEEQVLLPIQEGQGRVGGQFQ